jgi:hypothetical protein
MTITWNISQLFRQTSDGFVTTAHWQCKAIDGDFSASMERVQSWNEGTPTIPYADLTQDTVLGWIWSSGVNKNDIEAVLAVEIEAKKNPVFASGLPWSSSGLQ